MKLLLDTHALIWFLNGDTQLSSTAQSAIESPENQSFVSIAAVWEIAVKNSLGKLALNRPFAELRHQIQMNGFEIMPIRFEHAQRVNQMPFHHRDPFDRIMLAQALTDALTIISRDPLFEPYGVDLVW
ncbi:MAG: type II toxin-antitoxin system VapC family toxin [Saprospiraceae bacterium]